MVDWPCQARLVELVDCGGYLSIVCTMVDHDTPAAPGPLRAGDDLASLHRELAANMPFGGADSERSGVAADRNAELRIRRPFPLDRLRLLASLPGRAGPLLQRADLLAQLQLHLSRPAPTASRRALARHTGHFHHSQR